MNHSVRYIKAYSIESYDRSITSLYSHLLGSDKMTINHRVANISALLLGCPYRPQATGEGPCGYFDQAPLYRLDRFDCVTYINTVLALALSHDVISFRENLVRIAYQKAQLDYAHRHHFMSIDWNFYNQSFGLVEDITSKIVNAKERPIAQYANTFIDRPNWFCHRSYKDLCLLQVVSHGSEKKLLNDMQALAAQVIPQRSCLPYLPLKDLFDEHSRPIKPLFQQIPQGAIIEIVRPNWNLKNKIGTCLNVSHVGFAIWKKDTVYYRQASSIKQSVCDIPLMKYLHARLISPTIKGINIQRLRSIYFR